MLPEPVAIKIIHFYLPDEFPPADRVLRALAAAHAKVLEKKNQQSNEVVLLFHTGIKTTVVGESRTKSTLCTG